MKKSLNIFFHPFIFSIPIVIIIIILIPPFFDKYKTEATHKSYRYGSKMYYRDLNNDTFSEYICLHYSGNNSPDDSIYNAPAVQIETNCSVNKPGIIIGQFNFKNKWFNKQELYFSKQAFY